MKKQKVVRILVGILVFAAVVVGAYFFALRTGIIWHGDIDDSLYKVRGVLVNEINGDIDWTKVKKEGNISFAFIKATEGTALRDTNYSKNYLGATNAGLTVGIYHDFVYGSSGEGQAKYYISMVKPGAKIKPTVRFDIDASVLTEDDITNLRLEVNTMFDMLFNKYNKNPIILTTEETYKAIFDVAQYDLNNLVVQNLRYKAMIMDASRWNFWLYSLDATVPGISTPVSKLVYTSTEGDFKNYLAHNK